MLAASPSAAQRGVTAIELAVTLTIVGLVFALAAPSFSVWQQTSQVRTVAESIKNGLQLARNEALRRNGRAVFALDQDTGWTVTVIVPGSAADELIATRPRDEGSTARVTADLTPAPTAPATAGTVTFDGLGRVVDASPLTTIVVKSTETQAKRLEIQIASGGQVKMCDPDITNTADPRYCKP